MNRFLTLGRGGVIDASRIIVIASVRSAPVKRVLSLTPPERIISLTYGYPRESVLVLDGGYLVVVSQTIDELSNILHSQRVDHHEQTFEQFPRRP